MNVLVRLPGSALRALATASTLLLVLLVLPVAAQYKVIDAQGRVTYTDRPPAGARAEPLRVPGGPAPDPGLPYALRQRVAQAPVTLYTAPACPPCDDARALLRQRGIPHTERSAATSDGVGELQRLEQTTNLPLLRVGARRLVGFSVQDWQAALDAAGYPATSQLPPGYRPAPVQVLGAVPEAPPAARAPAAAPPAPLAPPPAAPASGIRF